MGANYTQICNLDGTNSFCCCSYKVFYFNVSQYLMVRYDHNNNKVAYSMCSSTSRIMGEGNTILRAKNATRYNNSGVLAFDQYFQITVLSLMFDKIKSRKSGNEGVLMRSKGSALGES